MRTTVLRLILSMFVGSLTWLFTSHEAAAQMTARYWVGGSGNWNDPARWSTTSGGPGGASVPVFGTDVFVDVNSGAGAVITLNVAAICRTINFTGSNAVTLAGTQPLTLSGDATLATVIWDPMPPVYFRYAASMTVTHTGPINLFTNGIVLGAAVDVDFAGKTVGDVTFRGDGAIYDLVSGNFTTRDFVLSQGTLRTNNHNFTCRIFDADDGSNFIRQFESGSSVVTVTGTGTTVLDLDDNGSAPDFFTLDAVNSVFNLTGTGSFTVETNKLTNQPHIMPVLNIPNANGTVTFDTENPGIVQRITFQNITFGTAGVTWNVTGNNSPKTYSGNISLPLGAVVTFNGVTAASPNDNRFDGTITGGVGTNLRFTNGDYTFSRAVTLGNGSSMNFLNGTRTYNFQGNANNVLRAVTMVAGAGTVSFANNGTNSFTNIALNAQNNFRFSPNGTSTIGGSLTVGPIVCGNEAVISSSSGVATISVTSPQTWRRVAVSNLNNAGAGTVTVETASLTASTGNFVNNAKHRTLYWVGGTGNWGSTSSWSLSSGGAGGECIPTITDDVVFDVNSFSAPGQTMTLDVIGRARSLFWGPAAQDNIQFVGTNRLDVDSTLTFQANNKINFAGYTGDIQLISQENVNVNVNFNGNTTLASRIRFNSGYNSNTNTDVVGGQSTFRLLGGFTTTGQVALTEGTLNTQNQNFTASVLDLDEGNFTRTFDMGSSVVTLTGPGVVLDVEDFDTGTNRLTVSSLAAGRIVMTNSAALTVDVSKGTANPHNIPNLEFTNATNITINSNGPANRHTFANITVAQNAATFVVNTAGIQKTYGNLSFQNNTTATFNGPAGNDFTGTVNFGTSSTVTINGSNDFSGAQTYGAGSTLSLASGQANEFSGAVDNVFANVVASAGGAVTSFTNTGNNTFGNVSVAGASTWSFNPHLGTHTSTVIGAFNVTATCTAQVNINSATAGLQARVNFLTNQTWDNVNVRDLNNTGTGVINITGVSNNLGNNATVGVSIIFPSVTRTLYWVGGQNTGVSADLWNNIANWSLSSGGPGGECVPTCTDNVVFDGNSFSNASAARSRVNVNVLASARDLTFTSAIDAFAFTPAVIGTNTLNICGSVSLRPQAEMITSGYSGTFNFISQLASVTVEMRNQTFGGNLTFNAGNNATVFELTNMGGFTATTAAGTMTITRGTVRTNSHNFSVRRLLASGTTTRGLEMGTSQITLTGTGTVLDLSGALFTFDPGPCGGGGCPCTGPASQFRYTATTGTITNELGALAQTIPDIVVVNNATGVAEIQFNSGGAAVTTTKAFRTITVPDNWRFLMNNNNRKTYCTIAFGNNTTSKWEGRAQNNNAVANADDNVFFGTVTFGTGTSVSMVDGTNLNNIENLFTQTVSIGSTATAAVTVDGHTWTGAQFSGSNTFENTLTFTNAGQATASFSGESTDQNQFQNAVLFAGANTNATFNGNNFFTVTASTLTFSGANANTTFSTAASRENIFNGQVIYSGLNPIATFGRIAGASQTKNLFNANVDFTPGTGTVRASFLAENNANSYVFFGQRLDFRAPNLASQIVFRNRTFFRGDVRFARNIGYDVPVQFDGLVDWNNVVVPSNPTGPLPNLATLGNPQNDDGIPSAAPNSMTFGDSSRINFYGINSDTTNNPTNNNFENVVFGRNNIIRYLNRGVRDFDNITFRAYNDARFARIFDTDNDGVFDNAEIDGNHTRVRNRVITDVTGCAEWIKISSHLPGVRTYFDFDVAQTGGNAWLATILQDIWLRSTGATAPNRTSQNVAINTGVDVGNNDINPAPPPFINFVPGGTATLYWVGRSTTDCTNWHDPANWSETSGGPSGSCIPSPGIDVVFDNNSFANCASQTVNIINFPAYCRNMTWTSGVSAGAVFAPSPLVTLQVYGNMNIQSNAFANNFNGTVEFIGPMPSNVNGPGTISKTIASNGQRFAGAVVFNSPGDRWTLTDSMRVENTGGPNVGITINYGILDAGTSNSNIRLEGNWRINPPATGTIPVLNQSSFVARRGTVTFDGNNVAQTIWTPNEDATPPPAGSTPAPACRYCTEWNNDPALVQAGTRSPFYNLVVEKGNVAGTDRVTIQNFRIAVGNDLRLVGGELFDNNLQIYGNPTGRLRLRNNTALILGGGTGTATVFPTCYLTTNIQLDAGNATGNVVNFAQIDNSGAAANNASLVRYQSGANQLVGASRSITFGAATANRGPATYGTLIIAGGAIKSLENPVTVNGSLYLQAGTLRDMGHQITGNNLVTANRNRLRIDGGAALELGTGTTAPAYPGAYPCTVPTPPAVAADALSYFPTFGPISDFASGGKMDLNATSVVRYLSSATTPVVQNVQGGFTYGRLEVTAPTVGSLLTKTLVQTHPLSGVSATSGAITVRDLSVGANVQFWDDGWQITGNAAGTLAVAATGKLRLGNATRPSTTFPSNFVRANINLNHLANPTSEVIYFSELAQDIYTAPLYGDLTLRDPNLATNAVITKRLAPPLLLPDGLTVGGNLVIEPNNNLYDDGTQINGTNVRQFVMRDGNTFLTLGNATVATQFPIGFTLANMTLETNSTVVYNANPNQTIRGDVPYQGLTARVQNPAGSNSQKTLSGPTTIRERFLIQDKAIVYDNGHQIDGTTTVDRALTGKNLTIEAGGQLVLGNASTATTFPTFGPVNNTVRNLDDNSTVVYNAGVDQTIEAGPFNYGNLTVGTTIGAAPGAMVAKTPNGTLNIDGTLTIRNNNNLVDDGQTINGNSNPGTQMIMENGSRLTIGTPTVATTFPSFSPVGNSPSEGVNAGTGKMNLHTGSTVVYRSEMPLQFVAGGFNYGSLEIVAPGATGFVAKALTAPARVKANFRIDQNNRFFDQGFQITGSPTGGLQVRPAGLLWMSNRAEMYLGSASSGTGFPTLYTRDRIDLQPCNLVRNTVYFQSDQTQNVSCEPIYGNVRLASSVAATKNLQVGPTPANTVAQIMGNLVIESNSTLDATASNLGITLGRDWVNNGVFNARAGKVNLRGGKMPTFSGPICNNFFLAGIEAQQQITSNTSNFYDLETDNTRGSLLMDNLTVNRTATFTDGHFSPRTPSPDASAPTDVNIPAATQVFIFGTNGAVAGPGAVYPADPTTNGPWHGSFVNGPVRKIGSTAFVFPTGKISSSIIRYYAPIGISDLSGSATFSAEYFFRNPSMIPYGYLPFDRRAVTDLAVISYIEYWLLDRNAGSTTARVKLSWDTPRSGGVGVPASLRVAHFNNSLPLWENRGNNNLLGIPLRGTLTSDPHGTFSPFTLGSIDRFDNLLPIELVSFEAIPQPAHVDLIWKTASETNNAYFTLEKSLDGVNFREFKRVASQNGNSNRLLTYRDIDPEPYRGISYYRLKQTDIDGKYSYSKIVSVRYDGAQNPGEFVVFPNPNNGLEINVQVPPNTLTRGMLTLHDVVGRRIHEQEVENPTDGVIRLKFAQKLAAGTYVVQIRYEGKVFSRSIVVQ